jgi:hypothetical protein
VVTLPAHYGGAHMRIAAAVAALQLAGTLLGCEKRLEDRDLPPALSDEPVAAMAARFGCSEVLAFQRDGHEYRALVLREPPDNYKVAAYVREGALLRKVGPDQYLLGFEPPRLEQGMEGPAIRLRKRDLPVTMELRATPTSSAIVTGTQDPGVTVRPVPTAPPATGR